MGALDLKLENDKLIFMANIFLIYNERLFVPVIIFECFVYGYCKNKYAVKLVSISVDFTKSPPLTRFS